MTISAIGYMLLSGVYLMVLLAVYQGLRKLRQSGTADRVPFISVIIAARNEQNRITPCLEHLEKIEYPPERFEVILIDDNSSDGTAGLIAGYCSRQINWKLLRLADREPRLAGKKNALLYGLDNAKGEIIFTTDADCLVPPGWLKNMTRYFSENVTMVLGYSPLLPGHGIRHKILQFDNLFSAIVSAAPTKLGYPFSSVGRNLAYTRLAYDRVGGYRALDKFRSGDDMHLTERFRSRRTGKIDFCADPVTFVYTRPPTTFREIFNQQIRKNSKVFKATPGTVSLFILIFIYYLSIPVLPVIAPGFILTWGLFLAAKFILELVCLTLAARIFHQDGLRNYLPLMQIVYPVYIIFFSLLGMFQKYTWKN